MVNKRVSKKAVAVAPKHKAIPKRKAKPTHKHVTLKAHHAKPYRKRHIGLLVLSIAALVVVAIFAIQYRDKIVKGEASSEGFVDGMYDKKQSYVATVSSSYGFGVTYDQREFFASAIDGPTGNLYLSSELGEKRSYTVVRLAPQYESEESTLIGTTFTLTAHPNASETDPLEAIALQDGGLKAANLTKTNSSDYTIGGKNFTKTTWQSKVGEGLAAAVKTNFVTYTGIVDGNAITIVLSLGLTESNSALFNAVIASITFGAQTSQAGQLTDDAIASAAKSRGVMDAITNTKLVSAADSTGSDNMSSEKIAALYAPAVVKVYHGYCMDVTVKGTPFLNDACSATSGSGFIVSKDGYVGTNGHVAYTTAKDLSIYAAIVYASTNNNDQYINLLLSLTTLTNADIAGKSDDEMAAVMIDALYDLPDSYFVKSDDIDTILVNIGDKEINVNDFIGSLKTKTRYSESKIVEAKLVGADYRMLDGYSGWRASDVALLKIDGKNFPIVTLGDLDSLAQGASLSILGYPGAASSNGLVESNDTTATLTSGKVSAVKKVSGSSNKLIETDTTIGHGNSGGPAFSSDGEVVGIATYTIDGSGEGNGTYNYIRDIKDFKDLASSKSVKFNTDSETQAEWSEGIENFYSAHYSKALDNFEAVKKLYPDHSKVSEFIASANKHIANGDDVVDFPWTVLIVVVSAVVLVGTALSVILIVSHKKHHNVYQAGVAQGTVQPLQPGAPNQPVTVQQPVVQPMGQGGVLSDQGYQAPWPSTTPEPAAPAPQPQPQLQPQPIMPQPTQPIVPPQPPTPAPEQPTGPLVQ